MMFLQEKWSRRRAIVGAAMYWSGLAWMYERVTRPTGAIILMYHSVADAQTARCIDPPNHLCGAVFERQMAFLSKHRNVISLSDLVSHLDARKALPAGSVCITFDDGYLDNLTVAAPILAKYNLPATLYLPTSYIAREQTHWADILHQAMSFRTRNHLSIPSLGLRADLSIALERVAAYRALHGPLLVSLYPRREELLAEVQRQLEPQIAPPRLTMNWDDVRLLQKNYPLFSVGGHSRDHIDLSTHGGEQALYEIEGCLNDLQQELGVSSAHFSYPYARWCKEARAMVVRSGWLSSVGNGTNFRVGAEADRYVLPRVQATSSMTDFKFKTSGVFPQIFGLLGR